MEVSAVIDTSGCASPLPYILLYEVDSWVSVQVQTAREQTTHLVTHCSNLATLSALCDLIGLGMGRSTGKVR